MTIKSVSVKSFGKLKDFTMNFNAGMNVIQDVNGFGKTTLAAFIKAMLYGFTYRASKGASDVSHYFPWGSSGLFGGSITLEHDGTTYRIERYFGKTQKAEQLSLINESAGKTVDVDGFIGEYGSLGEKFLGLTSESFERSAYFPQESVELASNDNFDKRLANLVESGTRSYENVKKDLIDYQKKLLYLNNRGGRIYELEEEIRQRQRELSDAEQTEKRRESIIAKLAELEQEHKQLKEKQFQLENLRAKLQKEQTEAQPTEEEKAAAHKLAELNAVLAKTPDFDADKARCDRINEQIDGIKDDVKPTVYYNKKVIAISAALIILGLALGIGLCFAVNPIAAVVIGAVLCACGAVGMVLARRKGITTLPSGERDSLVSEYYKIASAYVYCDGLDFNSVKMALWQEYKKYREAKSLRDGMQKEVAERTEKNTKNDGRISEITEQINAAASRLMDVSREQGRLGSERDLCVTDKASIQDKILSAQARLKQAKYEHYVAVKVIETLASAKDNLSISYLPKLNKRCGELLSLITGSRYETVIDRNFNLLLREDGQTKPISEFSRGIREITLLCFRISLSELLYNGAIPFIIIDDAFVNFDEDNFVRATELINGLTPITQVIYFTCHRRLGKITKN